jgi:hypothetical protein
MSQPRQHQEPEHPLRGDEDDDRAAGRLAAIDGTRVAIARPRAGQR